MAPTPPHVTVSVEKDVQIAEFTQSRILDEANIADIGQSLSDVIDTKDRPKLLIDFSHVEYLSSAALRMLIGLNTQVKRQNGQLRLTGIRPQIMEVFTITNLNRVFRILNSRADAIGSFE